MNKQNDKILVLDDDPFVVSMLEAILESGGYSVETAKSGKEALRIFSEQPDIVLILSDMNMEEMNGIEIIRAIREKNTEVPIIILTVNKELTVALEAIRCGANDYFLKDENIENTLLISVKNTIEKYHLMQQNIRLMDELIQKNKELERLSFLDGLTGVANRRYFDKTVAEEWGRAARLNTWLAVIMIDIDFFKRFNDTYGHQHGDDCLKQVAHTLNASLKRSGDSLFRYGGEEFAAILPNVNIDGAMIVAESMRSGVESLNISHVSSSIAEYVTISLGVGSMIPTYHSTPSAMIFQVDRALYAAKQGGRNQIRKVRGI
jgi:two-component system, chemotaxis family, response regulator WspR